MAASTAISKAPIKFGTFVVTSQVFYRTAHSFALVNLKPLLPGHVLVCPLRVTPRVKDLSHEELTDLFLAVQKVARVIEHVYHANSLNIAIQDGAAAGQSVPHVHTHLIPRHFQDIPHEDQIYAMLESDDGDLGRVYLEAQFPPRNRPKFPVPDGERKPRSEEAMMEEAASLAKAMEDEDKGVLFKDREN
ncbi:Dinucleoside triphosphate hydrolase [Rhizina undulata]